MFLPVLIQIRFFSTGFNVFTCLLTYKQYYEYMLTSVNLSMKPSRGIIVLSQLKLLTVGTRQIGSVCVLRVILVVE